MSALALTILCPAAWYSWEGLVNTFVHAEGNVVIEMQVALHDDLFSSLLVLAKAANLLLLSFGVFVYSILRIISRVVFWLLMGLDIINPSLIVVAALVVVHRCIHVCFHF